MSPPSSLESALASTKFTAGHLLREDEVPLLAGVGVGLDEVQLYAPLAQHRRVPVVQHHVLHRTQVVALL
eukprot:1543589-Pyramimonas_sp.AAC.1